MSAPGKISKSLSHMLDIGMAALTDRQIVRANMVATKTLADSLSHFCLRIKRVEQRNHELNARLQKLENRRKTLDSK